jgi:hypothetical protein
LPKTAKLRVHFFICWGWRDLCCVVLWTANRQLVLNRQVNRDSGA